MASLESVCPNCMRTTQVPDARIGRRVRCPWCSQRYQLTVERIPSDVAWETISGFYYLADDGERAGPVDLQRLIDRKESGDLTASTQLWREGWPHWKFGDSLFSSLPGRAQDEPEQKTPALPARDGQSDVPERMAIAIRRMADASHRLRVILFWLILASSALAAILAAVGIATGKEAGLGGAAAMALATAALVLLHRQVRAFHPATQMWAQSGEPLAGAEALARFDELLAALCWTLAGCVLATLVAVATALAF